MTRKDIDRVLGLPLLVTSAAHDLRVITIVRRKFRSHRVWTHEGLQLNAGPLELLRVLPGPPVPPTYRLLISPFIAGEYEARGVFDFVRAPGLSAHQLHVLTGPQVVELLEDAAYMVDPLGPLAQYDDRAWARGAVKAYQGLLRRIEALEINFSPAP